MPFSLLEILVFRYYVRQDKLYNHTTTTDICTSTDVLYKYRVVFNTIAPNNE